MSSQEMSAEERAKEVCETCESADFHRGVVDGVHACSFCITEAVNAAEAAAFARGERKGRLEALKEASAIAEDTHCDPMECCCYEICYRLDEKIAAISAIEKKP